MTCERRSTLTYRAKQLPMSLRAYATSLLTFNALPATLNRLSSNDNAPQPAEAAEAAMLMETAANDQFRIHLPRQPSLSSPSNARQLTRRITPKTNALTAERRATSIANTQNPPNQVEITVLPPCTNASKLRKPLKRTVSMSSLITQRQHEMMKISTQCRKTSNSGRSLRPRATERSNHQQTSEPIRHPTKRHLRRTSTHSQMPSLSARCTI